MGLRQVAAAAAAGHGEGAGWQTARHAHYATTDFPLWRAPEAAAWVRARVAARVLPAFCTVFGLRRGSLALQMGQVRVRVKANPNPNPKPNPNPNPKPNPNPHPNPNRR